MPRVARVYRRSPADPAEQRSDAAVNIEVRPEPGGTPPFRVGPDPLRPPLPRHELLDQPTNGDAENEGGNQDAERERVPQGIEHRRSASAQPTDQDARLALGLQVSQHHGDRLTHDAPAVYRQTVRPPQRQPSVLDLEQLLRRAVHGDLLVMALTSGRPRLGR